MLRNAARIGDFREVPLGEGPLRAAALQWDGVDGEAQVLLALKLNCWINSVERARFSREPTSTRGGEALAPPAGL